MISDVLLLLLMTCECLLSSEDVFRIHSFSLFDLNWSLIRLIRVKDEIIIIIPMYAAS